MTKGWEKVFFIGSMITQGASYLSPHTYGILHRLHHAYADTEDDPHSPKYDYNLFSMMWRTKEIYTDIYYGKTKVEDRFLKGLPEWFSFDEFANKWSVRIFWGLCYVAFYIAFATSWWMFLLLPIHFVIGPLHGAVINWFAHKYGYRNYKLKNTSTNLLPVDFLMLGESYHNNHHKYNGRPNFGVRWFEIDPVYPFILLFDKLGIIRLRVGAPITDFSGVIKDEKKDEQIVRKSDAPKHIREKEPAVFRTNIQKNTI